MRYKKYPVIRLINEEVFSGRAEQKVRKRFKKIIRRREKEQQKLNQ